MGRAKKGDEATEAQAIRWRHKVDGRLVTMTDAERLEVIGGEDFEPLAEYQARELERATQPVEEPEPDAPVNAELVEDHPEFVEAVTAPPEAGE